MLVDRGVDTEDIVRLLVATGTWSEAGATEIVSTLAPPAAREGSRSADVDVSWPTARGRAAPVAHLNTKRET
jgi:hypothetical protein